MRVRVGHDKLDLELVEEWLPIERESPALDTAAEHKLPAVRRSCQPRWRIERDYQKLKQEVGLGHGWRGFHHHATLCIATYGFQIESERPRSDRPRLDI